MATINDLPFNDTPSLSDSVPIYKTSGGVTQRTSVNQLLAGGLSSLPTVQPVDGSNELWIDVLDGNSVKAAIGPSSQSVVNPVQTVLNLANGTAPDAGSLTGAEIVPMNRGSGLLQTTLTKIAQWVIQTYKGFTQSGTGAVARTVIGKLLDMPVTPKDFGAKGDGAADDTAPLNAWWAYLVSSGVAGRIGKGRYKCSSLTWDIGTARAAGVKIEGDGPQQAILDMTAAGGTLLITCSAGAAFYSTFRDFGVVSNVAGATLRLGKTDYSDALNSFTFENLVINNLNASAAAIGYECNGLFACDRVNIVANCAGHGDALRITKAAFSSFTGAQGNADNGVHITNNYVFGNTFMNLDIEVVATCVVIDTANANNNTFIGGQYVWTVGTVNATAGNLNLFSNPNAGSGAFTFTNKVGVSVDYPPIEGTWAPAFTGGVTPTMTYSAQDGYFVKRGRLVMVTGRIALSAVSGGSGNLSIAGLPYAVSNQSDYRGGAAIGWCNGVTVTGAFALAPTPGGTSLPAVQINNGASTFLTTAALTASTDVRFTLVYETDTL